VRTVASLACAATLLSTALSGPAAQQPPAPQPAKEEGRALPTERNRRTGDFDVMIERRGIRVLVPYSRSLYFNDKGRERGISAEAVRDFEVYINQKLHKELKRRPITVVIIPTTRDQLLQQVADGLGDIAVGNLTATAERQKILDFALPMGQPEVSEYVLTGPKSPAINTADDLAGKTVHVRKSSSYHESLVALNDRLQKAGQPAVKLVFVPDALEDEDMMEMLNQGLFEAIVVDDWKARMWAQVLPAIKVNAGAVVSSAGRIGWAIRKGSPQLHAMIAGFQQRQIANGNAMAARVARYHKRVKQIQDPTRSASWKRFQDTLALFEKYGSRYGFDPLLLAAQGFQESKLDQEARSHVGAIGIMQVMPATGAELRVGDITVAANNVHAGAKYMDKLMETYFGDAKFSELDRSLFAFASYNAGPGNMARMRREAERRGLDANQWFNNVEVVTAEKIGRETTTYVRNIYKYYVSYRLLLDAQEIQKKAREAVQPGGGG